MLIRRSINLYHASRSISLRHMSSSNSQSTIQLVAEIRKRTTASIQKAREALVASKGDIEGALEWLDKDRVVSGQQKAEKVGGRFTGEGLVGVAVLTRGTSWSSRSVPAMHSEYPHKIRAAMVEVNCETDFVAKNELFRDLTQDVAFTVAYMGEEETSSSTPLIAPMDLSYIQNAPLMQRDALRTRHITVSEAVRDLINAVGENITIRRAATFVHASPHIDSGMGKRVASYVHNAIQRTEPGSGPSSSSPQVSCIYEAQGRIGALLAITLEADKSKLRHLFEKNESFEKELELLERGLARQVAGMSPSSVSEGPNSLYGQSFDTLPAAGGKSVTEALVNWSRQYDMIANLQDSPSCGINVMEFARWQVGESTIT